MQDERTLKQKLLANEFTPVVLMALNIAFFFYWLSDETAAEFDIAFGVVGGFITVFLSFWIALYVFPKFVEAVPILAGLLCISTIFVFGFLFIRKNFDFDAAEIQQYGVRTRATIADKSRYYDAKGRTVQSVDVQFLDARRQMFHANISVSPGEYERFRVGQPVLVTYSTRHPRLARIEYGE